MMIFIWGKKRHDQGLGFVADFCAVCKCERPFLITELRLSPHIYFVSLNSGNVAGYIAQCQHCRSVVTANPERYTSFAKSQGVDIEPLIQATFPRLREFHAQKQALEANGTQAVLRHTLQDRRALLMEPFRMLEFEAGRFYSHTLLDKPSGFGCLGTIILSSALAILFVRCMQEDLQKYLGLSFLAVACTGFIFTVIASSRAPGRAIRIRILRKIATAIAPLRPTRAELTVILDRLKLEGTRIGTNLDIEMLLNAIGSQPAQPAARPFQEGESQLPSSQRPEKPIPFKPDW